MAGLRLQSRRLDIVALDAADLDAWIAGDQTALESHTGARFPVPVEAPPLFGDDLPTLRMVLARDTSGLPGTWLLIRRDTAEPVGVAGFSAVTGERGVVTTGYSVYPRFERQGFMTEAMAALLVWLAGRPGVHHLRATIPAWNPASIRVAESLGMTVVGTTIDREVGEVSIYEVGLGATSSG